MSRWPEALIVLANYASLPVNLVNKDQLEILTALRESVNEDKAGLEADLSKLQSQVKELADKNKMQLEQINGLLLEKISLQSDGIGQREKMLERERNFRYQCLFPRSELVLISLTRSDLRATLNGKELPEDIKARLLKMHEDNVILKEQLSTTQSKLTKARNVRQIYEFCLNHLLNSTSLVYQTARQAVPR